MSALRIAAIAAACCAALHGLHKLADWAESRGWIYYRKTKPSGNALGASALMLQDAFESGKNRHVLEARENRPPKERESGPEPPHPSHPPQRG